MILFDQLRISDDGKRLYINIHVNEADYFRDVYLDSLTIMTADKVSETNPHAPTSDYVYQKTFAGNQKTAELVLQPTDFGLTYSKSDFSGELFFIYVKAKGTPASSIPCGMDEEVTVAVVFDEKLLYQRVMDYSRELADSCELPMGFADMILKWNAFVSAVETCHWVVAIKFWKLLFEGKSAGSLTRKKGCGCHG